MVKSLLNIFNREISGLHEAAYLLGFFAICSQVLALFRDRILASYFGASSTLDIYYSAFRIPDVLFVTIASIVSISVLIPFLIERFEKGDNEAREFINSIFTFFFIFMVISGVLAFIFTPFLLSKIFPVFVSSSLFSELISLTRILLLSPIFLGFSNLLASITQVHKRFFIYALSPVVYNLGIIFGIIFLYPTFGIKGLGIGVLIGACLHFAIQIPFIKMRGMIPRIVFPINFDIIKKIVFTSLPRTITVSSGEITRLFLVSFASFFVPGSIAVFSFSYNLQSVPLSIIGVSYSLAAFPTLARLFSNGEKDKFIEQIITSVRHIIFWSVPITVLFIVLRAQIVRTILGAGNFNWDATRLTAATLAIFVVSLVAQNLITLFVRAHYSQGKTSKPLIINVFSSIVTIFSTFYFIKLFQTNNFFKDFIESLFKVSDIAGTEVLMLPLGFSFGILVNLFIYWIVFSREFKGFSFAVSRAWLQVFSSSVIMGFVTYLSLNIFDSFFDINTLFGIFMQGLVSGLAGIFFAVIVLILTKNKELQEVWEALHRKIWKAKVIVPGSEPQ